MDNLEALEWIIFFFLGYTFVYFYFFFGDSNHS